MTRYVLDASVAAKWFLPSEREPFAKEALHLLKAYVSGQAQFFVPDLFFAEFANILWKAERQGRCSGKVADEALSVLIARDLPVFPTGPLAREAMRIARSKGRTVYDALYVALALELECGFITADEKLANAVGDRFPVIWLGTL